MRRVLGLLAIVGLWLAASTLPAWAQSAQSQLVSAARLTALAEKAVHAIITDPDRELQPAYKFTDQRVPSGNVAIEVQSAQYNPNYIAIPLAINVDGKLAQTVVAGYRIVQYVRTAVAAHDLPVGTVIADGDLTLARVQANGRQAIEPASLLGRKLNISVVRGTAVYTEQTRVNEIVIAGQPVIYILHDGPVAVSADLIARTGGGLGQLVAVYNPATGKALSGIVTGPGKVEFTLPGGEVVQ